MTDSVIERLRAITNDNDMFDYLSKYIIGHRNCKELINTSYDNLCHYTMLSYICIRNYPKSAKLLIDNGAIINDRVNASSPLSRACKNGGVECVKLLIDHGADVNIIGPQPISPLIALCYTICDSRHVQYAKLLIDAGADVNYTYEWSCMITHACTFGNIDFAALLIEAGGKYQSLSNYWTNIVCDRLSWSKSWSAAVSIAADQSCNWLLGCNFVSIVFIPAVDNFLAATMWICWQKEVMIEVISILTV